MNEQLQSDFDKITKTLKISEDEIQIKKNFLKKFIKSGFPNRKQEDWKFLDISQIIKKNISDLSFFNDYSQPNKIDSSTFIDVILLESTSIVNSAPEPSNSPPSPTEDNSNSKVLVLYICASV